MNPTFDEFLAATEACTKQIRAMLPMEQEKRQALISDDVPRMEKMMCEQQAAIMELENLDKERARLQGASGFAGMTATEILEQVSGEQREKFSACLSALRQSADQLRLYNQKATELAKASLQFWEGIGAGRDRAASRTTYGTYKQQASGWNEGSSLKIQI
ncbi:MULTISPECIES: flagellar export chaperone FlgN [Caproicibacterium]|uniref:Flagellar export chaperone FlgN n=1 Tax=Caproicibacterium argilliputei TaxID=3030016 RepID=A0AA97H2M1_9FIRM|nr:flagellar export chaperone FlgN [Caproicibacterium argilliputei]WOC31278.1 flagellar export chaperone FlgN [Caproicibacterium argilliputei]